VVFENKKFEFFVKEIISNDLLIVDSHSWKYFDYVGEYIIGKELPHENSNSKKNEIVKNPISILLFFYRFLIVLFEKNILPITPF